MKRTRHTIELLAFVAIASIGLGCADDDPGPVVAGGDDISGENAIDEIDLDSFYGGLAWTDEPEAFGDTALLEEASSEDDALAADDEAELVAADPTLREADVRRIALRIVWGRLDGDRADPEGVHEPVEFVDWTGALQVRGAVVALKRPILFERPHDHVLRREDRQRLTWVSHTGPHVDGILVCVLARPSDTGVLEGELEFRTAQLSRRFRLDELDGLDEVVVLDDRGTAVSFRAHQLDEPDCPQGFLTGYWHREPDQLTGMFRGRILGSGGRLRGFLVGRYGINARGERVLAGKMVDREGAVRGLLRGSWEPAEDREGTGRFQGHWALRNGEIAGGLRGRFVSRGERRVGFFQGMWREDCRPQALR
jgi:hypothetical protein